MSFRRAASFFQRCTALPVGLLLTLLLVLGATAAVRRFQWGFPRGGTGIIAVKGELGVYHNGLQELIFSDAGDRPLANYAWSHPPWTSGEITTYTAFTSWEFHSSGRLIAITSAALFSLWILVPFLIRLRRQHPARSGFDLSPGAGAAPVPPQTTKPHRSRVPLAIGLALTAALALLATAFLRGPSSAAIRADTGDLTLRYFGLPLIRKRLPDADRAALLRAAQAAGILSDTRPLPVGAYEFPEGTMDDYQSAAAWSRIDPHITELLLRDLVDSHRQPLGNVPTDRDAALAKAAPYLRLHGYIPTTSPAP